MNGYLLDPIERGERRAEVWEERIKGDQYACACGKTCLLADVECLSPDPYGEPFCPICVEKFIAEKVKA